MTITGFINKNDIVIGSMPVQRAPSDFGEVASLGFKSARDNFLTTSASRLTDEELGKRNRAFEELTGEVLRPELASNFTPFVEPKVSGSIKFGTRLDPNDIEMLRERHNKRFMEQAIKEFRQREPQKFKDIKTAEQVREAARERARASEREFEEARQRTGVFDRAVGGFLGTTAGLFTDPLTLATLPFGASTGKTVLQSVLIEAGLAAGAEAAAQPFVAQWQKEIGNKYGFTDAAQNVGFAALFGGGIAGVVRGAKPAASFVFSRMSELPNLKSSSKIAAKSLAKVAHVRENIPFVRSSRTGDVKRHVESLNNAAEVLVKGGRAQDIDTKITEAEFLNIDTTPKSDDVQTILTQLEEIKRFQQKPAEGELPPSSITEPKFTLQTLPQQVLDRADVKRGTLRVSDFAPEEIKMLESAGVTPNAKGQFKKDALLQERTARSELGSIQDLTGKETEHIESFRSNTRVNALKDQDVDKQVNETVQAIDEMQKLFDDRVSSSDVVQDTLRKRNSAETIRAEEENFASLAEQNPDLKITLEDRELTLKQLADEFADDENLLREITICGVG